MGWHRAEDHWWPVIAEELPTPWPREACLMDLRWYGDRKAYSGARIPGRAFFADRWGWSEKRSRTLIRSFEWWDPKWGTEADEDWGPAAAERRKGQARARRGPAKGQSRKGSTPNIDEERASEGPDEGQERSTGALRHPHGHPSPFERESRPYGQVEDGPPNRNRSRSGGGSRSGDESGDKLDPDLVTTVLRVLDRELDLLREITHDHRTDELVKRVTELVQLEGRQGLPNAMKWAKRQPSYPEVARVLRWVADENGARA